MRVKPCQGDCKWRARLSSVEVCGLHAELFWFTICVHGSGPVAHDDGYDHLVVAVHRQLAVVTLDIVAI